MILLSKICFGITSKPRPFPFGFFNSNNPFTLVFLPVIGLVLWLPSMISTENIYWHYSSPLFDLVQQITGLAGVLIAFSVILLTGFFLTRVINKFFT